jgi:hypothetical protein
VNLGWPARDADLAIAAVEADMAELPVSPEGSQAPAGRQDMDVAVVLRAALQKLSRA